MDSTTDNSDTCLVALHVAVDHAYETFAAYAAPPFPLAVCLACCVTPEIEQQLREWPLARLTAEHLYEYNSSAKPSIQPVQEVKHLLPRMLELLMHGEAIHHSTEISFVRLGQCRADAWSGAERAALDGFALAFFEVCLRGQNSHLWSDDPLSVLLMFDIGGIPIEPLLAAWLRCEHPCATAQYVDATYWHFWDGQDVTKAFATDRPAFRARIRAWLLEPACKARFMDKLLAPAFQDYAITYESDGSMPFSIMVDGVFDCLTQ